MPETSPVVTVAIPTWNRARLLPSAIRSALAQTLEAIEVVVSDNGSTDDTAEDVASYPAPRLHYLPLPANIGLHGNLTRCLALGTAPYVTILNDDDVMYERNLEVKVGLLDRHPEASLAHSAYDFINDAGTVTRTGVAFGRPEPYETGRLFVERSFRGGNRVGFSTAVFRRAAVAGECFDDADVMACDYGLMLRVATRGAVVFSPEALAAIRLHGRSYSVQSGRWREGTATYGATFRTAAEQRRTKVNFLERFGTSFGGAASLRAQVRRSSRIQLQHLLRQSAPDDLRPAEAVRLVAEAARVEPTVLARPAAVETVLGGVVGPVRARDIVARARRPLDRARPGSRAPAELAD